MHQGLDQQSHGITSGLNGFNGPLMRTVSQVHAIDFDYPVADLKIAKKVHITTRILTSIIFDTFFYL